MAVGDAYATADEYRTAKGDFATAFDASLDLQLIAMSRLLDRALRLHEGAFNSHTATYYFGGTGGQVLTLRDDRGDGYFLRSADANGIGIDTEYDGTYDDYSLDFNDAWVVGVPRNNITLGLPVTALRLLSHLDTCDPTSWPTYESTVRIVGTWGYAEVPQVIRDLVIHRVEELRDAHKAGSVGELAAFDGAVPMRPNTTWLFKEAERLYGRHMPAVA